MVTPESSHEYEPERHVQERIPEAGIPTRESDVIIKVGIISPLEVPPEDIGADDSSLDIDFSAQVTPTVRKPAQYEKFVIFNTEAMTTRLLCIRSGPGGIETKYFSVVSALRGPLSSGVRDVLVVPWWSLRDKRWALWVVPHNPGNSWFDSLQPLLQQPPDFYVGRVFMMESDRPNARYDIRSYDAGTAKTPTSLGRPVSVMLGQALGEKGFIRSPDHPVYKALTEGENVF